MTLKDKYERFEDFKADIWKWKSDNREEYNRFAQMMGGCDEQGLFLFYRAVAKQMPQIVRQWELTYNDDTCPDKFAEIDVLFKEQSVPQQIVEQYGRERIATYIDNPPRCGGESNHFSAGGRSRASASPRR